MNKGQMNVSALCFTTLMAIGACAPAWAQWGVAATSVTGQASAGTSINDIQSIAAELKKQNIRFVVIEGDKLPINAEPKKLIAALKKEFNKNNIPRSTEYLEGDADSIKSNGAARVMYLINGEDALPQSAPFEKEEKVFVLITDSGNTSGLESAKDYIQYDLIKKYFSLNDKNFDFSNIGVDFSILTAERNKAATNYHELGHLLQFIFLRLPETKDRIKDLNYCMRQHYGETSADVFEIFKMAQNGELDFEKERTNLRQVYSTYSGLALYQANKSMDFSRKKNAGVIYSTYNARVETIDLIEKVKKHDWGEVKNKIGDLVKAYGNASNKDAEQIAENLANAFKEKGINLDNVYLSKISAYITSAYALTEEQMVAKTAYYEAGNIKKTNAAIKKLTGRNLTDEQIKFLQKDLEVSDNILASGKILNQNAVYTKTVKTMEKTLRIPTNELSHARRASFQMHR